MSVASYWLFFPWYIFQEYLSFFCIFLLNQKCLYFLMQALALITAVSVLSSISSKLLLLSSILKTFLQVHWWFACHQVPHKQCFLQQLVNSIESERSSFSSAAGLVKSRHVWQFNILHQAGVELRQLAWKASILPLLLYY